MVMASLSEPFWAHERIDQIEKDAHRHQRAQGIVENHVRLSEPVADICVENPQPEKGEPTQKENYIKHGVELEGVA
jgi:hypothetical protein